MKYLFNLKESKNSGYWFLSVYDYPENKKLDLIYDHVMSVYDTYDEALKELSYWTHKE